MSKKAGIITHYDVHNHGAQLQMYAQWGHGVYEEAEDFNQTVLSFLKG